MSTRLVAPPSSLTDSPPSWAKYASGLSPDTKATLYAPFPAPTASCSQVRPPSVDAQNPVGKLPPQFWPPVAAMTRSASAGSNATDPTYMPSNCGPENVAPPSDEDHSPSRP